jgi:hypothetical protein
MQSNAMGKKLLVCVSPSQLNYYWHGPELELEFVKDWDWDWKAETLCLRQRVFSLQSAVNKARFTTCNQRPRATHAHSIISRLEEGRVGTRNKPLCPQSTRQSRIWNSNFEVSIRKRWKITIDERNGRERKWETKDEDFLNFVTCRGETRLNLNESHASHSFSPPTPKPTSWPWPCFWFQFEFGFGFGSGFGFPRGPWR